MKKILFTALLLCSFVTVFAQAAQSVDMADEMRSSGKIYVVVGVIAIVFVGLAIYLFAIDRRLRKIEKDL
jgi:CcmD family protein